jgi:hypothetical protein
MRYVTNCPISFKGDRIEKGVEIEVTAEDVERLGGDISPAAGAPVEEAPEVEPAIEEMTYDQLKAKAKALELSQAGSKADLVERITLHLQGDAGGDASDDQGNGGDGNQGGEGGNASDDQGN